MPEEVLLKHGLCSFTGMLGQACPDFHESLASVLEYSFCYVIVPKPEIIKFQGEKKNNEAGCFSYSLYKWQMHTLHTMNISLVVPAAVVLARN